MNKVVWTRGCKNYEPWRESLILVSPFYHIHGIFLLIRSLMDGTQIVVMKAFNEEKFCSLVQKYKVSVLVIDSVIRTYSAKNAVSHAFVACFLGLSPLRG